MNQFHFLTQTFGVATAWRKGLAKARAHIPSIYLMAAMVRDNVRAHLCYSIISSDSSACQCQGETNLMFKWLKP